MLLTAIVASNVNHHCRLFENARSQVTDHCAIDLDQQAIEEQLGLKTDQAYEIARRIYNEGGHSKSYALVTLSGDGLPASVAKGDRILGVNAEGVQVVGNAYESYPAGTTTVKVQYATTDIQESYVECQVGALYETNTKGCFAADGTLKIGDRELAYTYDVANDNRNGRTM